MWQEERGEGVCDLSGPEDQIVNGSSLGQGELAGLSLSALFGLLILLGIIPVSLGHLIAMTGNHQPSEHLYQLPQNLEKPPAGRGDQTLGTRVLQIRALTVTAFLETTPLHQGPWWASDF